jgi:KTSC domain-containing protein
MTLQMSPVSGGNIKSIGYDPATKQLHIEFAGGTYVFDDVPGPLHEGLMKSSSKGSFFHGNVKGRFPHRKVAQAPKGHQ